MLPPFVNIIPLGDENRSRAVAWVTLGLIVVNGAVFLTVAVASADYGRVTVPRYGLIPGGPRPHAWITHMFLHGNVFHILGNMLFLWAVAHKLEEALTPPGFLGLYLAGGLAAAGTHVLLNAQSVRPIIGASGAVAAVVGAYVVLFPRNRIKIGYLIWLFVYTRLGVWRVRSVWALGGWFAFNVLLGLIALAFPRMTGVAWWAHIGGFAFGAVVAGLLRGLHVVRLPPAVVEALEQEDQGAIPAGSRPEHLELARRIDAAVREGRSGEVLPLYQALVESGSPAAPSPEGLWAVAEAFERGHFLPQAAAAFERLVMLAPDHDRAPEAAFRAGVTYARSLGHLTKARFYLRRAAETHPDPDRVNVARELLRLVDLSNGSAPGA